LLVDALAHRWGVEERAYGIGKTVWAELKAPDIITRPTGTEAAAATVRPGQHVRLWGEWHEVAAVRSEQRPTDDAPTVLLLLDEGPPLRVRPTEPLTVRSPENA
ncbi:ATP-binding protein, partial [Streptomyces sp. TRM76130]|nr:ATP-binding protein [Streptomyces sp. TRM76130]